VSVLIRADAAGANELAAVSTTAATCCRIMPAGVRGLGAEHRMPEISRFLGIIIAMYYRDHAPPHFHAIYGEFEVTVEIGSGTVNGQMPRRALAHVQEWRELHRQELLDTWALARASRPLPRIEPLE
jgi:hypothetical protein